MPSKHTVQSVLEEAGKFIVKQKGNWNHDEWEKFLADAEKMGVPMDDEGKRSLGNILEASKHLFHVAPKTPAKKKAASKSKAKSKAKSKPKATRK